MNEKFASAAKGERDVVNGGEIWHALETSKVIRALKTSPTRGLASEEVASRFAECGPNLSDNYFPRAGHGV